MWCAFLFPSPFCGEPSLFHQFGNSVMIAFMFVYFLLLRCALIYLVARKPTKQYLLSEFFGLTDLQSMHLILSAHLRPDSSLRHGLASNQTPRRLMCQPGCFWFAFHISDFVTVQLPKLSVTPLRTEYMPFLLPCHLRLCVKTQACLLSLLTPVIISAKLMFKNQTGIVSILGICHRCS